MTILFNNRTNHRQYPRFYQDLPAKLNISSKEYFVICRNISEGGVFLEIETDKLGDDIHILKSYHKGLEIEIHLMNEQNKIRTTAVVRWNKKIESPGIKRYGLGMEFINIPRSSKNRLNSFIKDRLMPPRNGTLLIKEFKLLIGGEEVDTGQYGFIPYSEKAILCREDTKYMLDKLRKGEIPIGHQDYVYAKYCIGNSDTNRQAIIAARKAAKIFRNFDVETRIKIIHNVHELLAEHREELIDLLVIEGHPRKLAEWEIGGMLNGTARETVEFYGENIQRTVGKEGKEVISLIRRPDGVVCLATPKNAPSSISVIGIFALLSGNTIIVKPPLLIPVSTIYFWQEIVYRALKENGAPGGVVNIVIGNSHNIMQEWIRSPYTNSIIYIGDSKKGIEIGKKIYLAGKKPILELSGNDIMIIWKDAPIEETSEALLDAFLGSTQICMVPKVAVIHQEIIDRLKDRFLEKVARLRPGLPSDTKTYLVPVAKKKEFFITLNDALQRGAQLLCGGKQINWKGECDPKGQFIQPTVLEVKESPYIREMLCIKEEIFFPLLPLIVVSGPSDENIWAKIIEFTAYHEYGLRISAWTKSPDRIKKLAQQIYNCGILRINLPHADFSPYLSNNGGVNKSGGPFGEMSYIWQKTSHLQGLSVSSLV